MATIQELEDLTRYIRRILPDPKRLNNMRHNEPAGAVEFEWHARHFVALPTLKVFELKGQSLMLTGSSMLIQAALHTNDKNSKVLGEIVDILRTAEETMRGDQKEGLALLVQVKRTLLKLSGKKNPKAANPPKSAVSPS
jgi:hypothetical protein